MLPQQKSTETKSASADGPIRSPPAISLPKGGGAIRGMGEKFAAHPVTGTGSMTVPIATSPGRSGFGPQLSLSYDSGAGNGPYGFGWSLSLPSITRKTDKGLPKYEDADDSDVFILSGAEDLVPAFKIDLTTGEFVKDAKGNFVYEESPRDGYLVRRYRPRIEGLFARIERWTRQSDGDVYWRSISKDNITTFYGKTEENRIANPEDSSQIFSWLICQSYDDKGNAIVYKYKAEDSDSIDTSHAHEANRNDDTRKSNRYLKRIKYGNRAPNRDADWNATDPAQLPDSTWMFEVVFDYEDGHYQEQQPDANERIFAQATIDLSPSSSWPTRQDPFSAYRAGFEVRTYRLCRRVLMFHHFPDELDTADYLVRSTEFTYNQSPIASFITEVRQSGYKRQANGEFLKRSLPPLEFTYTEARIQQEIREIDADSLENLPYGLDGASYQWVDLDGEGLSGILTEQADGWFYKRNLSPINIVKTNGAERVEARFAPVELAATKPALSLASGHAQFLDLAGDGQTDVVTLRGPVAGFYERTQDASWEPFTQFDSLPTLDWDDPNLKFVDLTGDGHADILISEDDVFIWHPSLAEDGFGPAERVSQSLDEEKGPRLVFDDGTQSFYLADLSGDGLSDLVRIRNGEVCYWPNPGYCRFGAKVTMDNAPWFDRPDQFDQKRIRLADIEGSGTTDIIYLGANQIEIYRNESGNSWSNRESLTTFPAVDNLSAVQAVDLLGNGTACLVWSSPLLGDAARPMRYIDLMGGQKPHLLTKTVNNLGAESVVQYAPSTKFYLQDKLAGQPWVTKLPFPVHCVERVETYDRISGNRFVSRYAYHHGYFDGVEREFRGFGMVEQTDTEEIGNVPAGTTSSEATNLDTASFVPPIRTKTWFHTGVYDEIDEVSQHFAAEYYAAPPPNHPEFDAFLKTLLPDTVLPPGVTPDEEREASRALKGAMLRQEVYADDAPDGASEEIIKRASTPYSVTEQNFTIEVLQPHSVNRHAVFFTHPREALSYHYERNPDDPRIGHAITLEVDEYGNVLRSVAIGYGRGVSPLAEEADREKQTQTLITYTENDVTNAIDDADHVDDYRTPLPSEAETFELTGYTPANAAVRFQISDLVQPDPADPNGRKQIHIFDSELRYEQSATMGRQRRLIEHVRFLYRKDDLTAMLPLGELEPLALPGESYKLAFTPELLAQIYQRKRSDGTVEDLLPNPAGVLGGQGSDQGGYVDLDGDACWWIPSGRSFHSRNPDHTAAQELAEAQTHFFLPRRFRDPFLHNAFVDYDDHDLLLIGTEDALQNTVTSDNDYRVLQPRLITDPNGNRSQVAFDALGLVAGTAVMGKATGPTEGDLLDASFTADPTQAQVVEFIAQPRQPGPTNSESEVTTIVHELLGKATSRTIYDLERFSRTRKANPDDPEEWEPPFAATIVRETHVRVRDLPGDQQSKLQVSLSYSDGFGREIQKKIQAEAGPLDLDEPNSPIVNPRWVSSGWTIFNNKGKPVRQYEPFFDDTHHFKFGKEVGFSPILFYDPAERVVATLHPNHTYEKVVFDAWQQTTYDVNDTVAANGTETGDPRTDEDIKGYVARYFADLPASPPAPPWQTWHAQRIGGATGEAEQQAARKAAAHADTPAVGCFDTLGRTFLTVAHNRFTQDGNVVDEKYLTRVVLDIEGNQREVINAKGRIIMRYDYDVLSNKIHQVSMEAGERWLLNDITGKPIRSWDSRGHIFRTEYDALRRPVRAFVQGTDASNSDPRTLGGGILFAQTEYGEGQPHDAELNLRTRVFRQFDGAGVVTNLATNPFTNQDEAYDFKGNSLRSTRQLAQDYKTAPDWLADPLLEAEIFLNAITFDALNRPITLTTPDNSVIRPGYNEANLLETMEVNLRGATTPTAFVTNIDYDAKGQRVLIEYGNHVRTTYDYDPLTFRLIRLRTTRPQGLNGLANSLFKDPTVVQDLYYAYDPVSNITSIRDDALLTAFHNNEQIDSNAEYTYDAVYRLIAARGREHIGQNTFAPPPPVGNLRDYPFVGFAADPNDMQALRNYAEQYQYDAVGNFEAMIHVASNGNWTRDYSYNEPSITEGGKVNNRLSSTTVGDTTGNYTYDAHGNITQMPHLPVMEWDFKDQLHITQQQVVNDASGERTYYGYDAAGQRARKVTERSNGTRKQEHIYLGGFETYREYNGDGSSVTLEREAFHVMDDKRRVALVETKTIDTKTSADALPNTTTRYQFDNHLGSACIELDENGAGISYEEYYPFGNTSYQAGGSLAEVSLKRYRFTGRERDDETGLYYQGARYYCSWLGRWSACDPLGFVNGTNLYAYVTGNPIRLRDPSGTQGQECVEVIGLDLEKQGRFYPGPGCAQPAEPSLFAVPPRPGSKEARTPPLQIPKSVPKAPAKPKSPKDDPEVSDPEALRYAEGVGKIEAGDVEQFGKGLWNGPASWVNGPQFEVDPHYGGAAWVGGEMGKNLALELLTAGVGKLIGFGIGKARNFLRAGEDIAEGAAEGFQQGAREVAGSMPKEAPAAAKKIKYLNELTDAELDAYMQSKFGATWDRAKAIGDWEGAGTPRYMSPEQLREAGFTEEALENAGIKAKVDPYGPTGVDPLGPTVPSVDPLGPTVPSIDPLGPTAPNRVR